MTYSKIVATVALAALPMLVSAKADSNLTAPNTGESPAAYKESSATCQKITKPYIKYEKL